IGSGIRNGRHSRNRPSPTPNLLWLAVGIPSRRQSGCNGILATITRLGGGCVNRARWGLCWYRNFYVLPCRRAARREWFQGRQVNFPPSGFPSISKLYPIAEIGRA